MTKLTVEAHVEVKAFDALIYGNMTDHTLVTTAMHMVATPEAYSDSEKQAAVDEMRRRFPKG